MLVAGVQNQGCGGSDGRGASGNGGSGAYGGFGGIGGSSGFGGGGALGGFGGGGGEGGFAGTAGTGGEAGISGTGGDAGTAGLAGTGGTGGAAGMAGVGGAGDGGAGGVSGTGGTGGGSCCSDGDCLCHGPAPTALTAANGSFRVESFTIPAGKVHFPADAEPPFAAVALCGGFLNTGPEMDSWGSFYASHGIVTVIVSTLGSDFPDIRATKLAAGIAQLKEQNTTSGSALFGKLAGRFGTSGYSMGGGGTTLASVDDPTLRTSIGLAPWSPVGTGVQVPTLFLCGTSDTTAPCSMAQGAFGQIPASTPKMMISISGVAHLDWFGPTTAGMGTSGKYALAFQKVFLEGDERWRPLLLASPSNGTQMGNVQ